MGIDKNFHKVTNERLITSVKEALSNIKFESNSKILEIVNPVINNNIDTYDLDLQKNLKLGGKSLTIPVTATLRLKDKNTGKIIDESKQKIFDLPIMTPRNSFIDNGNEYQGKYQMRLRPSVYTRIKANGELEAQFNLARGANFDMELDPERSKLVINMGTSSVDVYPILKELGISDAQIDATIGKELAEELRKQNAKSTTDALMKMYEYYNEAKPESREKAKEWLKEFFGKTVVDPFATKLTLGKPFESITPEALLAATKKIVSVSRGEVEPDNREKLVFKNTYDVVDHLKERIIKKTRQLINSPLIKYKLDNASKIDDAFPKSDFRNLTANFFNEHSLMTTTEQTNPLTMLEDATKTTITGEGGITNVHAITEEARLIDDSQMGFLDPIHTPSSDLVGATAGAASGIKKIGDQLATELIDASTGKIVYKTPSELVGKVIGLPNQYKIQNGKPIGISSKIIANVSGKLSEVSAKEVDYYYSDPRKLFGYTTNMIPFASSNHANRAQMSTKMLEQAVSLIDREPPLVQTLSPEGKTYVSQLGELFSFKAPVDGIITKVKSNLIELKDKSGKIHKISIYDNFPLNRKSDLTSTPVVSVGQSVKAGDLLADTNFTKNGDLSLGKNLIVTYLPYKGYTFEDGIVISESAAKKLTSRHVYQVDQQKSPSIIINKDKFVAYFPKAFTSDQLSKINSDGIIQVGSKVNPGDPLILALRKDELSDEYSLLKKFKRTLAAPYKNQASIWDGSFPGVVTNISNTASGITIYIVTEQPAVVGDKLVSAHANKGIITAIVPDEELPRTKDGVVPDVLYSPMSIPGRINPSQLLEIAGAKIAQKTGKPYIIENFKDINYLKKILEDMKKYGVPPSEPMYDPKTGREIGRTTIGPQYTFKLHHVIEDKMASRFLGGFDINGQPTKPAQNIGLHDVHALLAYGMKKNLHEMASYKGQRNDEFWRNFMVGGPIPSPKTSFAYDKFISYLRTLGIKVNRDGDFLQLMPLSDKEVINASNGKIDDNLIVKGKNLEPIKNGLFDPKITGGIGGDKWAHIELEEPIVNPVYIQPIAHLLDITKTDVENVLAGKTYLDSKGQITTDKKNGLTGSAAIQQALLHAEKTIDMQDLMKRAETAKDAELNKIHRKLRYLTTLKKVGLKPHEAYMIKNVPVLPPVMRPIFVLDDGSIRVSSLNYLYRDIILANKQLKSSKNLPEDIKGEIRRELYKAVRALQGLGDPITKLPTRDTKGVMQIIAGSDQAKNGFLQASVFKRPQEMSGRSTITLGIDLAPDEVGIPKDMAWNLFKPFIIKDLASRGFKPNEAIDMVEKKHPLAEKTMETVVKDKLVLLSRAPVLHKFGWQAFKPVLHEGRDIKLQPLTMAGFNADLDGDTLAVHVPVLPEAQAEAAAALPSNNLRNPKDKALMLLPDKEAVFGLYAMTDPKNSVVTKLKYNSEEDIKKDILSGVIYGNEIVELRGKKVHAGREVVKNVIGLPVELPSSGITKKFITEVAETLAKLKPKEYSKRVNDLAQLGFASAWRVNAGLKLEDLGHFIDIKNKKLPEVMQKIKGMPLKKAADILKDTLEKLLDSEAPKMIAKNNSFYNIVASGARGNKNQFRQLMVAPGYTINAKGEIIPIPVTNSYAEGLPIHQYWSALHGGRKGTVETQLSTAGPGELYKQAINSLEDQVITIEDCNTTVGLSVPITDKDAIDRFLAVDVVKDGRVLARRNDIVTADLLGELSKHGIEKIVIRSPLYCKAPQGTCAKCYGLNESGQPVKIGTHIGVIAAHALTEPLTQMMLSSKHTGGIYIGDPKDTKEKDITTALGGGFKSVEKMLTLPRIFQGSATLSKLKGKVTDIVKNPAGGWNIFVENKKHFSSQTPIVKPGDKVGLGDPLSEGMLNPRNILELKGVDATRNYIVETLKNIYNRSKVNVDKKHIELITKNMTNVAQIIDPSDSQLLPGDETNMNLIRHYNSNRETEGKAKDFIGHRLAADTEKFKSGALITPEVAKTLGDKVVKILKNKIKYKPKIEGINMLPLTSNDWLSRLNYTHIKDTLLDGAAMRWTSHLHGINPVPAYIYGAEFGKNKNQVGY